MDYVHMNPAEAVLAHRDLGEPNTLVIHFGTFQLADEGYDDPLKELDEARRANKISSQKFHILKIGESWIVPEK